MDKDPFTLKTPEEIITDVHGFIAHMKSVSQTTGEPFDPEEAERKMVDMLKRLPARDERRYFVMPKQPGKHVAQWKRERKGRK